MSSLLYYPNLSMCLADCDGSLFLRGFCLCVGSLFMFWGLMHQNINNLGANTYVVQNLVLKNKNYDVENEFLFKYRMLKMDFCCKKLKQIMLLLFLFCFVVVRVLIWCCCLLLLSCD
jgi:hypothetical protein